MPVTVSNIFTYQNLINVPLSYATVVVLVFLRCLYQGTSAAGGNCSGGGFGGFGLDVSELFESFPLVENEDCYWLRLKHTAPVKMSELVEDTALVTISELVCCTGVQCTFILCA